ncbi:hypothetical protein F5884DRAFT_240790 [Xylogone sp. PMI_703]|nr:hypothetical protein F5884DRAFT_240790 [Xylogone sp. PMI_703]
MTRYLAALLSIWILVFRSFQLSASSGRIMSVADAVNELRVYHSRVLATRLRHSQAQIVYLTSTLGCHSHRITAQVSIRQGPRGLRGIDTADDPMDGKNPQSFKDIVSQTAPKWDGVGRAIRPYCFRCPWALSTEISDEI